MRTLIVFFLFVAIATAQYLPPRVPNRGPDDVYGASLAGAPVGLYGKNHLGGPWGPSFPFPGGYGWPGLDEVYAASLGGAPVGLYGKEHFGGPGGPFMGPYGGGNSEVTGASLGGSKVGLYGKNHGQQQGGAYPVAPPPYRPPVGYGKPPYKG